MVVNGRDDDRGFERIVYSAVSRAEYEHIRDVLPMQSAGPWQLPTYTTDGAGDPPTITLNGDGIIAMHDTIDGSDYAEKYPVPGATLEIDESPGAVNYVCVELSNPEPYYSMHLSLEDIDFITNVPVFQIVKLLDSPIVSVISHDEPAKAFGSKLMKKMAHTERFIPELGDFMLGETAGRVITIEDGHLWVMLQRNYLDALASDVDVCNLLYHDANGDWAVTPATQYNNSQYDTGFGLATVNPNRYVVNWILRSVRPTSRSIQIVLAREGTYSTLAQAVDSPIPEISPATLATHILIGRAIFVRGGTSAALIESAFTEKFAQTPLNSHEDLFNLLGGAADDHYHLTKNELDAIHSNASSGRLWGGVISTVSGNTVNVSAGAGVCKRDTADIEDVPTAIDDGQSSPFDYVSWSTTNVVLTEVGYNIIFWDASAGAFSAVLKDNFYSGAFDFTRDFTVGRVYYDGSAITIRLCGTNLWNFNRRAQMFGEERFPVERAFGMMISDAGGLDFSITAGRIWAEMVNPFSVDAFSSTTDTFTYWYRDGVGGWTSVTGQSAIDNLRYDDGDGTLGTLTNNRYGVHWVFEVHDSSVHVVYGRGDYLLSGANSADVPTPLPGIVSSYGAIVGKIVVQKSSATLYSVQTPFTTQFTVESVSDHNELSGLQGGTTDEYYHLTAAQHTEVANLATNYVATTGDQAVAGVKTFSSSPIGPEPTTDFQLATKKYVDDNAGIIDESQFSGIPQSAIVGISGFLVDTSSDQTISGYKAFQLSPIILNQPVNDTDAVNKLYVDQLISNSNILELLNPASEVSFTPVFTNGTYSATPITMTNCTIVASYQVLNAKWCYIYLSIAISGTTPTFSNFIAMQLPVTPHNSYIAMNVTPGSTIGGTTQSIPHKIFNPVFGGNFNLVTNNLDDERNKIAWLADTGMRRSGADSTVDFYPLTSTNYPLSVGSGSFFISRFVYRTS